MKAVLTAGYGFGIVGLACGELLKSEVNFYVSDRQKTFIILPMQINIRYFGNNFHTLQIT
jgi:hypothetical protein